MPALLQMRGITKSFPGVRALQGVDLDLATGEVLALLGENGAGKSTLIKVLGGAHVHEEGTIEIDGHVTAIANPHDSQVAGIGIIYQEFNLVPGLTVRENLFLGQEGGALRWINARRERERAKQLFRRLGVPIDPEAICGSLTVAQQQIIEIAKALAQDARIIVMDEPSAALTLKEVDSLFA
ncbi:MAG TPA: ATP-binding cassette domain-containing protein, partial [Pirellulaceae bacterium]|nr:ATP-binding cassette domain-containing protein [Pirellulaceae bacterium]